jgi:uncharacterized membrane protein
MSMETGGALAVSILAGIALAAAAGLRAFLPLLAVGIGSKLGLITLADRFDFLGSNVAIIALSVAAVVELAADKIPLVDHGLDAVSTFVRPAAGFLAAMAVMGNLPEPVAIVLAMFFAMVTLGTHLGKAQTRVASTATTAGLGNPAVSVAEDGVSAGLSILAVVAPLIAAVLVFGMLFFLWRLFRRMRRLRRARARSV